MGDTASQLEAGDLIGSQCTRRGVYEIYIYNEYLAIIEMRRNRMWRILQIGEDDIGRGG